MRAQRFYIGKKDPEEYADGSLEEWIADRIPSPPPGTICECKVEGTKPSFDAHHHDGEVVCTEIASSYLYVIKDGHVCYRYVCFGCEEAQASDDYLFDVEYPTTESGYAVTPAHCS